MRHRKVSVSFSDPCLVAPAPQLRARIRERLRRAADMGLEAGRRLTVRPQNRPGLNDGSHSGEPSSPSAPECALSDGRRRPARIARRRPRHRCAGGLSRCVNDSVCRSLP